MMGRNVLLAVLSTLLCSVYCELLQEVTFDISPNQTLPDGYTASDPIGAYLQSSSLKWLRYFNVLVSGQPGPIRMRVAHLMFKDAGAWAQFQQDNLVKTHALFDHFWVNSRRLLWQKQASELSFPHTPRQEDQSGGFIFQLTYSITPGKEQAFHNEWRKRMPQFVKELGKNKGFLERSEFVADAFQSGWQRMVMYDFVDMPSLVRSMHGQIYQEIFTALRANLDSWATTILAPGADQALYWTAAGADKADEL